MIKCFVTLLLFCVWQVLLDECCKKKIVNGVDYTYRETNENLMTQYQCLDNCVYEDNNGKTVCFKEGDFPGQCVAPTNTSEETGLVSLNIRDNGLGFQCDILIDYSLNQTFKLMSQPSAVCTEKQDLNNSLNFLEEKKFQLQSKEGISLDCTLVPIWSNSGQRSIKFSEAAVGKSLNCSVTTDVCLTNGGPTFPAKCEPTFRYKGREYHACTDKGLQENDNRLWCATKVDINLELLGENWGFCNNKCSYCGGSNITNTSTGGKSSWFYRPCGYDCLINPIKPMSGSEGVGDTPLLSPAAELYGPIESNFIKEINGQIQLYTGEQIIKLTCPLTKFIDPALQGLQNVYAVCGPTQYRFTIYSNSGSMLHKEFKNDRFGCSPCPKNYHYVPGYQSSGESSHIGTSFSEDVSKCEKRCHDSKSCKSFSFSNFDQTCKIFSKVIVQPTLFYNKLDYATCTQDAGCCSTLVLSSTGGTAEFQSIRLGTFVQAGRYNNRAMYKQEDGSKILFYAGYEGFGWVVASSVDSLGGLRTLATSSAMCPERELFWDYYTGTNWVFDEHLTVSCQDSCPVSYTQVPGYLTANEFSSNGIFFDVETIEQCKSFCEESCACETFEYSKQLSRCQLIKEKINTPSIPATTNLGDLLLCAKDVAICKLTRSDQGLTPNSEIATFTSKSILPGFSKKTYDLIDYAFPFEKLKPVLVFGFRSNGESFTDVYTWEDDIKPRVSCKDSMSKWLNFLFTKYLYYVKSLDKLYLITHGYATYGLADCRSNWVSEMGNTIKQTEEEGVNVAYISLCWDSAPLKPQKEARGNSFLCSLGSAVYLPHAASTAKLGEFLASIVKTFRQIKDDIYIHGIGHSLGAHIMGQIYNFGNEKLSRISGLDPAGPCFEGRENDVNDVKINNADTYWGLTENSAFFVDNIHSNGKTLGTYQRKGHLDFFTGYPDSYQQPTCNNKLDLLNICQHSIARYYFERSITDLKHFYYTDWEAEQDPKSGHYKMGQRGNGVYAGYHAIKPNTLDLPIMFLPMFPIGEPNQQVQYQDWAPVCDESNLEDKFKKYCIQEV